MTKARLYPSSIPFIFWSRPTPEQQREGILAIMVEKCHMYHEGRNIPYEQRVPYREESLMRRYKRTGELPAFISLRVADVTD